MKWIKNNISFSCVQHWLVCNEHYSQSSSVTQAFYFVYFINLLFWCLSGFLCHRQLPLIERSDIQLCSNFPPWWEQSDLFLWPPQPGWSLPGRSPITHLPEANPGLLNVCLYACTPPEGPIQDSQGPAAQLPPWLPPAVRCPFSIPPSRLFLF